MRVEEVMTTAVQTIRPQALASDARDLMERNRIHHLVVMEKSTVVGVHSTPKVWNPAQKFGPI